MIQKWQTSSIFVFRPFSRENNRHKLRKMYWIWQVATVRSINHNMGALKELNTGAQSINTESRSVFYSVSDTWHVPCTGHQCQNGATCHDGVNSYSCACAKGFDGIRCDNDIDDCRSAICLNNATCVDAVANYTCNCSLGYTGLSWTQSAESYASQMVQHSPNWSQFW